MRVTVVLPRPPGRGRPGGGSAGRGATARRRSRRRPRRCLRTTRTPWRSCGSARGGPAAVMAAVQVAGQLAGGGAGRDRAGRDRAVDAERPTAFLRVGERRGQQGQGRRRQQRGEDPWQARAVTSIVKLTEAPPTAEAAANPASPARKVTLRPIRSASLPPNSSRLPNDSEYAVTIHCRSAFVNPSARCADGSARFITVTSRTIMRAAQQMVARTSHRRESASPTLTMLLKRLVGAWVVDISFLRVARNIRVVLTSGVRLSLTPGLRTSN